jgi:hypothetical protein
MAESLDVFLTFFEYEHLEPKLQEISKPFYELAKLILSDVPRSSEMTESLVKLSDSKCCAIEAINRYGGDQGDK